MLGSWTAVSMKGVGNSSHHPYKQACPVETRKYFVQA
jgi:hypothetical protein